MLVWRSLHNSFVFSSRTVADPSCVKSPIPRGIVKDEDEEAKEEEEELELEPTGSSSGHRQGISRHQRIEFYRWRQSWSVLVCHQQPCPVRSSRSSRSS
jgi:hypothetical protein